jgi:hypothetical protein
MSYTTGKIQRIQLELLRLRHAEVLYTISAAIAAVAVLFSGSSNNNHIEPPFGDGGSAVGVYA